MHWIGVDVGGTFTDVVVYDEHTGVLEVTKSPTSRADPTVGLLNALAKLPVSLSEAGRIVYGTTIGTNAILERTGARVWVITTRGSRDTLEIARTNRTILYDIRARKPASVVPRARVIELRGRYPAPLRAWLRVEAGAHEGEIALDAFGGRILGVSLGDTVEVRHLPMPPIPGRLVSG